jgi:NADH-quinone oxidoreductase subunit M
LFGQVKEPDHQGEPIDDLNLREWVMVAPIALLCVVLGVYPQPVLESSRADLETVAQIAKRARQREADSRSIPGVALAQDP